MSRRKSEDKPFKVPVAEICRAILWCLDRIRQTKKGGREIEWIPLYDIQAKSGVSYHSVRYFANRYRDKGLEVITAVTRDDKIRAIRPTNEFEKYLKETFKPYEI